jgi:hypothetical protein
LQTTPEPPNNYAVKLLLTLVAIACAGTMVFSHRFYTEALDSAFFGIALASVVILHLRVCRKYWDVLPLALGTIFFGFTDFRVLHYASRIMAWFSFLGMSSFLILAIRTIWMRQRKILLWAWAPAALFAASDYFASTMLAWTEAAHPKTLDLYLLAFDGSLRVQVAYAAGRLYALHSWLHVSGLLAYIGLAVPVAVVYAAWLVRTKERAMSAMVAFLITGPVGILFYNIFPACGPIHLVPQAFPFHPLPIADIPRVFLEPVAIPGARNAMPSLHLAWTLLAWWYSRGLSWIERCVAFAFLALTAFATMGTGEHWFVDLVVAFPFALMIQAACMYRIRSKDPRRLGAFLFGLLTTLAWLAALRWETKIFWISPLLPWAFVSATIALSILSHAVLEHAASAGAEKEAREPSGPCHATLLAQ